MDGINPLQTRDFLQRIANLERSVYKQQVARQPYRGDWYDINPNIFTYSSATKIYVLDESIWTTTEISHWVRIELLDVLNYFYVINKGTDVNGNYWIIFGGSNYSFTNNPIQSIGTSSLDAPSGTQGNLEYVPSIASDASPIGFSDVKAFVTMKGRIIGVFMDAGVDCNAGAFEVTFGLPFPQGEASNPDETYNSLEELVYARNIGGDETAILAIYPAIDLDVFYLNPNSFSTFADTFFRVNFFKNYMYLPPAL